MSTEIKCPKCGHEFEPTESIRDQVQKELRTKMTEWQKKQEDHFRQQLIEEKKKTEKETEEYLRKSISSDFETKLRRLEENNRDAEQRLKEARQRETEFLRKEQELKTREEELELNVQKRLREAREKLSDELRRIEEQKAAEKEQQHQLRLRELEKQLEDQKKLAEEMRRKAEQGSTQLQGEVQEVALEKLLQDAFSHDSVEEVRKGAEGADCILTVRNAKGEACGKIIFESKRTRNWQNAWIEKLKSDMRREQADVAVLVSQVYPRGTECFGIKDGVWIASFREFLPLTTALRDALIRIAESKQSEENREGKMQLLYDYLTGIEFRQRIEAILEGFMAMKNSITRERIQMEKLWKEREKQIDKVLVSTSGLYGSIKGIAGASVQDIPLLEAESGDEDPGEE